MAHRYDVTLKLVLSDSPALVAVILGHTSIQGWLNVELPKVLNPRVDLLGATETGGLVHMEIQSTNDARMALRMAQYGLQIYDRLGEFPQQIVLYFGEDPMQMPPELSLGGVAYRYRLVDVRDLDGDQLIQSEGMGDNIVGVLARVRDREAAVRRVLDRIVALPPEERIQAVSHLMIVAGLRSRLSEYIEMEARKMPILYDLLDHPVLGREFKRGLAEGEQRGLQKGLKKGRAEGERRVLRKQIETRFGSIPATVSTRLDSLSAAELEKLSVRLLDASSLDELLG